MRVADFIAKRLASAGVDTCFMVTGGGAMHLNDAFGAEPRLRKVFCHHEQALAMAAEGYARVAGKPALVNVTTGPGSINALNGVFGAFTDSIPMIVVSGQVKRETLMAANSIRGLRQLGDQEVNITDMVRSITKWRELVMTPEEVPAAVDRALMEATNGRPGPVWLDVPIDIQGMQLSDEAISNPSAALVAPLPSCTESEVMAVLDAIANASRPVIVAGSGIRIASATEAFLDLIARLGIPVTTAWTHDLIPDSHPLFAGRPGTIGTRAGNFAVQHSDCVLVLGSRLNIRQVSYNWKSFARSAKKIWVDIDAAEFTKPFVKPDMAVHADLRQFIAQMTRTMDRVRWAPQHDKWVAWCSSTKRRYSPKPEDYPTVDGKINPYHLIAELFQQLSENDIVVCGDATATIVPYQIGAIKQGMRLLSNSGAASMGYDLPAAIGAAIAKPDRRVVCLAGDGSLMMNIQELQTVASLAPNVKIMVLDNDGYLSIKQTQRNFFGRDCGTSPSSGLSFPDFEKLGNAFGLPSSRLVGSTWREQLSRFLTGVGPALCVAPLDTAQEFQPRLKSRMVDGVIQTPELEDMFPFLDRDELSAVKRSALSIVRDARRSQPITSH